MDRTWLYIRRILLAELVVMPAVVAIIVVAGMLDRAETASFGQLVHVWGGIVLVYAALPAGAASLIHTAIFEAPTSQSTSTLGALILGGLAGSVVGYLVDSWRLPILFGLVGGGLYALLLWLWHRVSR